MHQEYLEMGTIQADVTEQREFDREIDHGIDTVVEINNGDVIIYSQNQQRYNQRQNVFSNVNLQEDLNVEEEIPENYWKWTIFAVSAPFTLLGLPAHLIFGKHRFRESTMNLFSGNPTTPFARWFRSILDPSGQYTYFFILTLTLLTITAGFTMFLLTALCRIFYHLVILGEITDIVGLYMLNSARTFPAVIPILFCWIRGYSLKSLVNSFDQIQRQLRDQVNFGFGYERKIIFLPTGIAARRNVRATLGWMYFAILVSHVIHILAESSGKSIGSLVNYWIEIMYSFVLPLYCAFVWAISKEYELIAGHLQTFQRNECQPTFQLFGKVKDGFKKVIVHVYAVNDIFRIFMSWVIPVIIFSIVLKFLQAMFFLFGYATLKNILTTGLGIGLENKTVAGNPNPTPDPDADLVHAPAMVRAAVGYIFVVFVQLGLLGFTIWQAVKVNDQARYLHVLLNDYGNQVAAKMTPELYHSYRMLKYFMHSTMEQENSALLRLPVLSAFVCIPQLRHRLQGYDIRS